MLQFYISWEKKIGQLVADAGVVLAHMQSRTTGTTEGLRWTRLCVALYKNTMSKSSCE